MYPVRVLHLWIIPLPEVTEVEKLRTQIAPAWLGRKVIRFTAPHKDAPDPTKYAKDGWSDFSHHVRGKEILKVLRLGKNIWIGLETDPESAWSIHLGSSGWFMPGNELAHAACTVDGIERNFLHPVDDRNVRIRVHLDDGQLWNYHDARTWGTWKVREGKTPRDHEYFQKLGPDWLDESAKASMALINCVSKRDSVHILMDQSVAAGIGHYLANETLFTARIHPHRKWNYLNEGEKIAVAQAAVRNIRMAAITDNHNHWAVFLRKGKPCPTCNTKIVRAVQGKRGDYLCPRCQRRHK